MEEKIVYGMENIMGKFNLEISEEVIKRLNVSETPFVFLMNNEIVLYGDADDNGTFFSIRDIWSKKKKKGYGRAFIDYLFGHTPIREIRGESTTEAVPFWFKVGANFQKDVFDDFIDNDSFEDLIPFKIYAKTA